MGEGKKDPQADGGMSGLEGRHESWWWSERGLLSAQSPLKPGTGQGASSLSFSFGSGTICSNVLS